MLGGFNNRETSKRGMKIKKVFIVIKQLEMLDSDVLTST